MKSNSEEKPILYPWDLPKIKKYGNSKYKMDTLTPGSIHPKKLHLGSLKAISLKSPNELNSFYIQKETIMYFYGMSTIKLKTKL